jgi:TadE-like protein
MVRFRLPERFPRGQALVETALVLPILAILMVMALDFGRVFFGWVALQNAARIGADFAATVPLAWDSPGSAPDRARYVQLVQDDLDGINCTLANGGAIPDPTFEDIDGNGEANDDGDYAIVELHCEFALITPLAQNILGGPVAMAAHEEFPVNVRHVQGIPPPPPPPPECTPPNVEMPELIGLTMGAARDLWVAEGFLQANFHPAVVSTGPPSGRNVNKIVLTQTIDENDCVPPSSNVTVTFAP